MSSRIKTHRRNQALEHCQQSYRFSIPVDKIDLGRLSFQPKVDSPLTFRSSDISKIAADTRLPQREIQSKEILSSKTISQKTSSTLLSTFQSLQEKLAEAKKQFKVQAPAEESSITFELNSFKQSSSGSGKWIEDSLLEKLEESTINLESQKRLINAVQSKERIIWAQKIKGYYLSEVVKGIAGINERAFEHLTISLEILRSCMSLALPNIAPQNTVDVPILKENVGKKTLVIDLDETLFHCSEERNNPEDIEITLTFDDTHQKGYVSIRPYAISFLKRMRKHYEIVAFTASERSYADTILNQIDPEFELIQHRLYREHCVRLNSKIYAKDLRILGRDLAHVVLVDNSPFSYLYQVSNGVPILPYYSGDDNELLSLQRYLEQVRKAQDVRKLNRDTFKLHRYIEFEDCEQLVKELYCPHY